MCVCTIPEASGINSNEGSEGRHYPRSDHYITPPKKQFPINSYQFNSIRAATPMLSTSTYYGLRRKNKWFSDGTIVTRFVPPLVLTFPP